MRSREEFGKLFQQHKQLGIGAEIGVHQGVFTKIISENWDGQIICVDIWTNEGIYKNMRDSNLRDPKYRLVRDTSMNAAKAIPDGSLDWVYIDADHSYESIMDDYNAWEPKVRKGGIVCGHDYDTPDTGVKRFIDELGVSIGLTTDDTNNSWWYLK